ncbi:D-tyrosyl-tRNA(Tyr) deacylase [Thalassoglobus neptunius]|uniref:D-aminoacyl-tRNA deacylase n=1 Tax=Thalassoglobus neptunius TaxID=1938619 RepID=A0A5C5X685_9PLAN|nr:D-aminoacyl-tRNA deacylase [Thalassoglobus neptunius]TWT58627.1 D-tyrosyl-tRNA(Tyr) deacylase [Thalassoglobus neptunius]
MRAVVQRVSSAQVTVIDEENATSFVSGRIGSGFVVLVGISSEDTSDDLDYIVNKLVGLRVFEDDDGKMNRSIEETGGEMLVISQFTLYGDCRKGRRPSFVAAASPESAKPLYETFLKRLESTGVRVESGQFQAQMQVELVNDGPVTLLLDSSKGF